MKTKYLPIGSIVLLQGGTKKVMVTGHVCQAAEYGDRTFDYRGCPWPEGVLDSKGSALFDNDMIDKVVFTGCESDEALDYLDKIEIIREEKGI